MGLLIAAGEAAVTGSTWLCAFWVAYPRGLSIAVSNAIVLRPKRNLRPPAPCERPVGCRDGAGRRFRLQYGDDLLPKWTIIDCMRHDDQPNRWTCRNCIGGVRIQRQLTYTCRHWHEVAVVWHG